MNSASSSKNSPLNQNQEPKCPPPSTNHQTSASSEQIHSSQKQRTNPFILENNTINSTKNPLEKVK